jgi:adenosylhomocysteine nucleosidase
MADPDSGQPAARSDDASHADVGIVCALHRELAPLLDRCEKVRKYSGGSFVFRGGRYDQVRVAVVESGLGFARSRRATQALLDAHTPPWVLSCGYSGALRPEMRVGDIVVADSIVDAHGQELSVDLHMPTEGRKGLHRGRFVTADEMIRTSREKQELAERHQAIAVDMESLAVAQVCRERGTPFLAVRVISDDLSADLPPEVLSVFGSTGTLRAGAIIGSLWKRPSSVKDLWKLREQANFAAERLATFLDGVLVQLYNARH